MVTKRILSSVGGYFSFLVKRIGIFVASLLFDHLPQQRMSSLGVGQGATNGDETSSFRFPPDLISPQDRKDDAMAVLKSDVMAALQKEVKSLDEDSWKFAGPRSQIHLISRPGGFPYRRIETAKR